MSSSAPGHIAISSLPPPPVFGLVGNHGNLANNALGGKHPPKTLMSLDDIFDDFLLEKAQSTAGGEKNANTYEDDDSMDDDDDYDEDSHKKKRHRGLNRNMTEEQKIERR
jgi:hypothetical protein